MTSEFPSQKASNAENVSIWWRHRFGAMWSFLLAKISLDILKYTTVNDDNQLSQIWYHHSICHFHSNVNTLLCHYFHFGMDIHSITCLTNLLECSKSWYAKWIQYSKSPWYFFLDLQTWYTPNCGWDFRHDSPRSRFRIRQYTHHSTSDGEW